MSTKFINSEYSDSSSFSLLRFLFNLLSRPLIRTFYPCSFFFGVFFSNFIGFSYSRSRLPALNRACTLSLDNLIFYIPRIFSFRQSFVNPHFSIKTSLGRHRDIPSFLSLVYLILLFISAIFILFTVFILLFSFVSTIFNISFFAQGNNVKIQ